ncbi:hypothetical protein ZOSMA_136G00230 [Zostera marina]|uniref:Bifunctional inhibitor/plant lipid transfer protein/seed storage helical domain-containing protein n=1 Tax=Zostera marina TaxID=29655 RepID=A0A0K9Q0T5_ZOSMR|nr:hypothetical protein ZOSMA_136G00230 [Zostera marina]
MASGVSMFLIVVGVGLLLIGAPTLTSAGCSISQFQPCLPAIVGKSSPSSACCQILHGKTYCYCELKNTPVFKQYYSSSVAHKISSACHISIPHC